MTKSPQTALISVSDKTGLVEFARELHKLNINIISTGGTAKALQEAKIPVKLVSDLTDFPEIMQGRVKTLHPKIAGGILGKRDQHQAEADEHNIPWIDIVVCNLYPFAETIKKPNIDFDTALENIDIGGPTMIRAAAKNFPWVTVVVDPADYEMVVGAVRERANDYSPLREIRKKLATKAFAHTAQYDAIIAQYMNDEQFPQQLTLAFEKTADLRYGENPHQMAAVYQSVGAIHESPQQHQGKQLSYNNIMDADMAIACLREFSEPACVVVKHANPCGVAQHQDINQAFTRAWDADSKSAFGGIVTLNRTCTATIANHLVKVFIEILIAPDFEPEALKILQQKPNIRVLETDTRAVRERANNHSPLQLKHIAGGILLQTPDNQMITKDNIEIVTKTQPTAEQIEDLLFAWKVVKHVKSNAIVIAANKTTVGIGHGQVSRIDAVDIAIRKSAGASDNLVLASDAFFPFRDSIDAVANHISAVIQPGGSIRDQDIIDACDEHNIAMVFTGKRCFNH